MSFDPNAAAGADSGIFGLPISESESSLVLIPVPWEATTSYGGGTAEGPLAILNASRQVDLFDGDVLKPYEPGIYLQEESEEVRAWNQEARTQAQKIIEVGGELGDSAELKGALNRVNELSGKVNEFVAARTREVLKAGKIAAVLGGDHSVPFGALQALSEVHPSFGILHFDAHLDLRKAYEGFSWSHASIMHNVMEKIPAVTRLVQVGIRDYCEQEWEYSVQQGKRIRVFTDRECAYRKFEGESWSRIAKELVDQLPEKVWVSFDIDGLDPRFCPHTGTPVPGGLDFQEANYLLAILVRSGRKIIGFDLNEVAPGPEGDEWDANVGARILYKLCAWAFASQGKCQIRTVD